MRVAAPAIAVAFLLTFAGTSLAQESNGLVGTWERFAHTNRAGKSDQALLPKALLIFSSDGYYSQTAIPRGRSRTSRPLSQLTLKEMLARFDAAEARYGKFTVSGDTLMRTSLASLDPANERSSPQIQFFRLEGDTLILRTISTTDKTVAKFRRLKQ